MLGDNPAKATFEVGKLIRNTTTGSERILRQINEIEGGGQHLLVRQDESNEKSILLTWNADNCEPVNAPITFKVDDYVTLGSSEVVRKILDTREHNKSKLTQYRVDLEGESQKWVYAEALHHFTPLQEASVGDKMKATDELPAATPSESARGVEKRHIPAIAANYEKRIEDLEEQLLDARRQNKSLEKDLTTLQNMVASRQPIPVAQMSTCVEYKTLKHNIWGAGIDDADRELAEAVNGGWAIENLTIVSIYSFEHGIGDSDPWRYVTLKRTINTPVTSKNAIVGTEAFLTGAFVRESMGDEQPIASWGELLQARGVEGGIRAAMGYAGARAFKTVQSRPPSNLPARKFGSYHDAEG